MHLRKINVEHIFEGDFGRLTLVESPNGNWTAKWYTFNTRRVDRVGTIYRHGEIIQSALSDLAYFVTQSMRVDVYGQEGKDLKHFVRAVLVRAQRIKVLLADEEEGE